MIFRTPLLLSLGVGISVLAFCGISSALTRWRFPPATCIPEDSTSLSRIRYSAARLWSTGGTSNVACPIIAPWVTSQASTDTDVLYIDNSSSTNLSCTHYWIDSEGDEAWSWGFTSSGNSTDLNSFHVSSDNEFQSAAKTWRCTLPNSSNVFITNISYETSF